MLPFPADSCRSSPVLDTPLLTRYDLFLRIDRTWTDKHLQILQRVYKYGGQPFARDYLARHHGDFFDQTFGKGNGKAIMHASAGSLIGIGEIVLLPLDVLKIKRQTNPEAFRGRGLFRIIADEGFGLYRGWGWTAARNAPGSFAVRRVP